MEKLFTRDDVWNGGFYELCFELSESSEKAAQNALTALWSTPSLEGCYLRNDVEPGEQQKVSPLDIPSEGHKYGIATLPIGKCCACGSYTSNYEADGWWVNLYLPLGSLNTVYPVGAYPFVDKTQPSPEGWLKPVNEWYKDIAEYLYPQLLFTIGIIGFETGFVSHKEQALRTVPEERWEGILLPINGKLKWYPPTIYLPQF